MKSTKRVMLKVVHTVTLHPIKILSRLILCLAEICQ